MTRGENMERQRDILFRHNVSIVHMFPSMTASSDARCNVFLREDLIEDAASAPQVHLL